MKVGFIGCGNMATAMIDGLLKSNLLQSCDIIASDQSRQALDQAKERFGIVIADSNAALVKEADVVVLAVKPQFYEQVIDEIKGDVSDRVLIITIAPGKTLDWIEQAFGKGIEIVRAMPNTPAMVGEGITAVCANPYVSKEHLEFAHKMFCGLGKAEIVSERLMDAVVAVSGSSPAYIFVLMEAMADAAVAEGMPRSQAYTFAAQAVLGSAKMMLATHQHPAVLKDMVCSPGGTTIEAVRVLEQTGFRSSIMQAMKACAEKSRSL